MSKTPEISRRKFIIVSATVAGGAVVVKGLDYLPQVFRQTSPVRAAPGSTPTSIPPTETPIATSTPTAIPTETPTPFSQPTGPIIHEPEEKPTRPRFRPQTTPTSANIGENPSLATKIDMAPLRDSPPGPIFRGDRSKPMVAVTLDDAWDPESVRLALDIAERQRVKVTLFPVGRVIPEQAKLWQRAVRAGHEIGNHTLNHHWLTELTDEEIRNEVRGANDVFNRTLGLQYSMSFLRPPGGAGGYGDGDPRLLRIAQEMGLRVVMWSVDPLRAESTYEDVVSNTGYGDIILLHFRSSDIKDLESIIVTLKDRGLKLVTLSELLRK